MGQQEPGPHPQARGTHPDPEPSRCSRLARGLGHRDGPSAGRSCRPTGARPGTEGEPAPRPGPQDACEQRAVRPWGRAALLQVSTRRPSSRACAEWTSQAQGRDRGRKAGPKPSGGPVRGPPEPRPLHPQGRRGPRGTSSPAPGPGVPGRPAASRPLHRAAPRHAAQRPSILDQVPSGHPGPRHWMVQAPILTRPEHRPLSTVATRVQPCSAPDPGRQPHPPAAPHRPRVRAPRGPKARAAPLLLQAPVSLSLVLTPAGGPPHPSGPLPA